MIEQKFTDEEKILSLLKVSDDVYANAKLTPEEAKALLDLFKSKNAEIERLSEDLRIQNKYWLYYWKDVFEVGMEKLKAESIKDFADDLMARAYLSSNWSNAERGFQIELHNGFSTPPYKIPERGRGIWKLVEVEEKKKTVCSRCGKGNAIKTPYCGWCGADLKPREKEDA